MRVVPALSATNATVRPSCDRLTALSGSAGQVVPGGSGITKRTGAGGGAARPRPNAHPAAPAATSASAAPNARARRARRVRVGRAAGSALVTPAPRPSSASAKSRAVLHRSAGSFSSARATASSTRAGTVRRRGVSGRGSSVMSFAITACALGPVNGGSPASIS